MKRLAKPLVSVLLAATMLSSTVTVGASETSEDTNTVSGTIVQETPENTADTDDAAGDAAVTNSDSKGTDEITAADKPYLALGSDLSEAQQATVLSLMGVDAGQLDQYDVVYVTNAEEHSYLDSYIASSEIGSKSLSSVVIVQKDKGSGLNITTKNISFCTEGMYQNACATAGITDADIVVAGPTSISGTAALVGIFKAYSEMTGKEIPAEIIDGALNELVVTGRLEDSISSVDAEDLESLIAYLKQQMVENGLDDEDGIRNAVEEACKEYGISLTDDEKNQIIDLLLKLSTLDLDADTIGKAQELLNSLNTIADTGSRIGNFFSNIWKAISDFFRNLFG